MTIKSLSAVLCGLLVACGGAAPAPIAPAAAIQTCPGGVVRGAAQLENYGKCGVVLGDLSVSGVASLAPLSELRSVSGKLSISNTAGLRSLQGLEQLATVAALELRDNRRLRDVSELGNLRRAREIVISGNDELRDLDGLSGINQLDALSIRENGLYSLAGTDHLEAIGVLEIKDNAQLINPSALNGLIEAQEVVVEHNPRLSSRFGFLSKIQPGARVALARNNGLDKSVVARFQAPIAPTALAVR